MIIGNEKQGFVVLAGAGNLSNNGSLMATQGGVHMVLAQAFKLTLPSGSHPFLNVELAGAVRRPVDLVCPMRGIKVANIELQASQGGGRYSGVIEAISLLKRAAMGQFDLVSPVFAMVLNGQSTDGREGEVIPDSSFRRERIAVGGGADHAYRA